MKQNEIVRGIGLLVTLLMLLAVPATAFAGGLVVSLDEVPTDVKAGTAFDIGFTITSMHGDGPVDWANPVVEFTTPKTGELLSVTPRTDAKGHYIATVSLPTTGEWAWRVRPFGKGVDEFTLELTPLQVAPASESSANQTISAGETTTGQTVPNTSNGALNVWPVWLGGGLAIVLVSVLMWRRRVLAPSNAR